MHRSSRVRGFLASVALVAALATGCEGSIVVATPETCEDALLGPVMLLLAEDGQSTVARPDGVVPVPLLWPAGYGLRPDASGGQIVNERGETVARIGERVWLGGGFSADDTAFHVCGEVMHEDPAAG